MQPRFAALLFALGLCDLIYVNLGLGPEVFASSGAPPAAPPERGSLSARGDAPPVELARATPPAPPHGERSQGTLPDEDLPASSGADVVTPAPDPRGAPLAPGPNDDAAGTAPTGARPGSAEARQGGRASLTLEVASEPAARDAVEAGRAGEAELTALADDLTLGFPDTASAQLTRAAREELLTLAARLRERPTYRLRVIGHADARGSREFNKYLGARRARAVFEILTAAGVAPEQLEIESRGEEEPRAVGASENVWAANRRVEIRIASERSETP